MSNDDENVSRPTKTMSEVNSPELKRRKIDAEDTQYFSTYSHIGIHEEMIADRVRTSTYRLAILRNYEKIRGKVVADIGAGTGILSMFCVHAGARKVYAIEASSMAIQAREVIRANNMSDRIEIINSKVEDTDLPEQVDVIVSEWMGYFLLYESMLPTVLLARDQWLKKDGIMLPDTATLYLAPFSDTDTFNQRESFWTEEVLTRYKVDLSSLVPFANRCISQHVSVNSVLPQEVLSHASQICHLDLTTVNAADLLSIKASFNFKCFGHAQVHGFTAWFKVTFPNNVVLSTSPYDPSTHWQQSLVFLDHAVEVEQDTTIKGQIKLSQHSENRRFLDISVEYKVDEGQTLRADRLMDHIIV